MKIETFNANPIEQSEPPHSGVGQGRITQAGDNTVSDHATSQQTSNNQPTDGAREVTTPKNPSHADIERMTEERLMEDPEYVALKEKLDSCSGVEEMFLLIDKNVGIRDDDTITMGDIFALVNDTRADVTVRAGAKWLNDHRDVLSELRKGSGKTDDFIGLHDVKNFIQGMKDQLKAMKNTARDEIRGEQGVKTTSAAATGTPAQAPGAGNAAGVMAEAGQSLPKPAGSEFSGLEGATANLNNMIGWGEAETDRLTGLMAKTDDPAVLKQLETKINQMSRRMQQMAALMNQLMTAMQNISKMYSDIAMNSVRNIK